MIQSFLKSMKLDLSLIIIVRQSMRNIYMDWCGRFNVFESFVSGNDLQYDSHLKQKRCD
jgi:hypothetical protein